MTKELNFFQDQIEITKEDLQLELPETTLESSEEQQVQIDHQVRQHLKRVIEALLFTSSDPIPLHKIREITDTICPVRPRQLRQLLEELQQDYISQQHAFKLEEIAQGYVIRTHEEYAPYIDLLYRQKKGEKLSHAATEVLAIIAYRQPITRPQVDAIRGVDSSGTVTQLLERNLIEPIGRLEAPGRPTLYGTTKEFLKHFGLKDITELSPR
jgi:segregation and condensation protein B